MNPKVIVFNKEARKKLAEGADILARAVVSTLGPRSRNVSIDDRFSTPKVIHDGVSVAKAVILKEPHQNMGAKLLREASSKTNDLAGDGTTTATLIANTIIQEGLELTEGANSGVLITSKVNAMFFKEELDRYSQIIVKKLSKLSKKTKKTDLKKIAKISAGSQEIADLVLQAINKVGVDGLVMVEPSDKLESNVQFKEGMEFDNGFLSPKFATDPNKMTVDYSNAYLLLTDRVIADFALIQPIIEKVVEADGRQNKTALLIIAGDVVNPALMGLVVNKLTVGIPLVAVMAPEYADRRKLMLDDISVLTGAKVFSSDTDDNIKEATLADLGKVSCTVTATHTTITPLYPDVEEIEERINVIKDQLSNEESPFLRERLKHRLAKLSQGIAIINVGGVTEQEISDKKERVIDAVHAVKAAMSEGVIAGGGVALRDIANELVGDGPIFELIKKALKAPYETILKNSGIDYRELPKGVGVDVVTKDSVDMLKAGIIDPVKVTRLAIINAFSVAGMMITTDVLIADDVDDSIQKIRVVNRELE